MMSPKLDLNYKGFSFRFFSREEGRPHVHVHEGSRPGATSKFWVSREEAQLASNDAHIDEKEIRRITLFLEQNRNFVVDEWEKFFSE